MLITTTDPGPATESHHPCGKEPKLPPQAAPTNPQQPRTTRQHPPSPSEHCPGWQWAVLSQQKVATPPLRHLPSAALHPSLPALPSPPRPFPQTGAPIVTQTAHHARGSLLQTQPNTRCSLTHPLHRSRPECCCQPQKESHHPSISLPYPVCLLCPPQRLTPLPPLSQGLQPRPDFASAPLLEPNSCLVGRLLQRWCLIPSPGRQQQSLGAARMQSRPRLREALLPHCCPHRLHRPLPPLLHPPPHR